MSLQTIISSSPLAEDQKEFLLQRLELEGATPAVITSIKESLQEYIDAGFKKLGVELDQNDSAVKAVQQKFQADITAAEAEYNEELENVSIDTAISQAKANKGLNAIQVDTIKASIGA
jgi:hypothetical protein